MWYLSSWRDLRRRSNAGHGLGNKPEITPPSHFYHRPDGTRWTSDFDTNAHHRRLFTAAAWRGLEPAPGSGPRRAFLHLSCSLCTIGQFIANLPFLRLRRTASRPEEFHLRPLTERCGSLSAHTAPTKQPVGILRDVERLRCRQGLLLLPVGR